MIGAECLTCFFNPEFSRIRWSGIWRQNHTGAMLKHRNIPAERRGNQGGVDRGRETYKQETGKNHSDKPTPAGHSHNSIVP